MKGEKSKNKCKKEVNGKICGTVMIASSDPFLATIFGGRGKVAAKKMSQWTVCPKCGAKGIERLE